MLILYLLFISIQTQNIQQSYYALQSPVYRTYWCGIKNENKEQQFYRDILFVLTEQGRLYKSINYGKTFTDESSIFDKMDVVDNIFDLYMSPANIEVVYLFGRNGNGFKSEDCGAHYTKFQYPKQLYDFKFNSMDDEWILAFMDCPKCGQYPFTKNLYITTDGGNNWKMILSNVQQALWDKLIDSELIPDERIVVSHLLDNSSIVTYSDDYYKTHRVIHPNGTNFFQTNFHMFVTVRKDLWYNLYVAPAFYDYAELQPIKLPIEEQYAYTLLDTKFDQVILSVQNNQSNPKISNIYTSDFRAFTFSLSLMNNVRSLDTGTSDFERIQSLQGVFIANVFDHQKLKAQNYEKFKRTFITFDKGAAWHPLKAPSVDSEDKPTHCGGDCSLHLQGRSVSKLISERNAIGVIIGSGNLGLYLEEKEISTYLSRDGGHNWHEIRKGHYQYVIADRGGLIVMATYQLVEEILYSWDEGLTWSSVAIQKMTVNNIIVKGLYQQIIIVGTDEGMKGILLTLDFGQLKQRVCSGAWDPTDPDSDYEFWVPKNFEDGKCLFGQKFRYTRRKREVQCFNQQDHDKIMFIDVCECTAEDWECDYGFYRKIDGGPCVPIAILFEEDDQPDLLKPPEICEGTYTKTQGYRKITGDFCQNGYLIDFKYSVDLSPQQYKCPDKENKQENEQELNKQNEQGKNEREQFMQIKENLKQSYGDFVKLLLLMIIIIFSIVMVCRFSNRNQNKQNNKEENNKNNKNNKNNNRFAYHKEEMEDLSLFADQEEEL